jgi:hypothetical protein
MNERKIIQILNFTSLFVNRIVLSLTSDGYWPAFIFTFLPNNLHAIITSFWPSTCSKIFEVFYGTFFTVHNTTQR